MYRRKNRKMISLLCCKNKNDNKNLFLKKHISHPTQTRIIHELHNNTQYTYNPKSIYKGHKNKQTNRWLLLVRSGKKSTSTKERDKNQSSRQSV